VPPRREKRRVPSPRAPTHEATAMPSSTAGQVLGMT
jgi:hypothetical protein